MQRKPRYAETLRAALIELLKVRTLVTLTVVGATVYGFLTDRVSAEVFVGITMAVITYYFRKGDEKP